MRGHNRLLSLNFSELRNMIKKILRKKERSVNSKLIKLFLEGQEIIAFILNLQESEANSS